MPALLQALWDTLVNKNSDPFPQGPDLLGEQVEIDNKQTYEWTPGVADGQGGLACCDSWGRKESDMTE